MWMKEKKMGKKQKKNVIIIINNTIYCVNFTCMLFWNARNI